MRAIFILILGLAAANAMAADWRLVGFADDGYRLFVDAGSIRIKGSIRRVWTLDNLGAPDNGGVQSRRALLEYDCREGRFRFMQLSGFPLPDARGGMTFTHNYNDDDWRYVEPGTTGESAFKFVCAKK